MALKNQIIIILTMYMIIIRLEFNNSKINVVFIFCLVKFKLVIQHNIEYKDLIQRIMNLKKASA